NAGFTLAVSLQAGYESHGSILPKRGAFFCAARNFILPPLVAVGDQTATNGSLDMLLKSTLVAAGLVMSAATAASAQAFFVGPGPYYGPAHHGPPLYAAPPPCA